VRPVYEDDHVTLFCADVREVEPAELVGTACVITSPPYNVGLDYEGGSDLLPWAQYWQLAEHTCRLIAGALPPGGRVWVNTAVAVPEIADAIGTTKRRVLLGRGWADALEVAGLDLVDQVAWCSARGSGTAWGSWRSPSSPNLRGDYEVVTVACRDGWERTAPTGLDGWRDGVGGWPELCTTVWQLQPEHRDGSHPAPFPVELAARCVRLSTWPGETVLDPFAGSGSTLIAAGQLGRRR
jgi:hypothetical protein